MFQLIFFGGTILLGIIVINGDYSLFDGLGIIFVGGTALGLIGMSVDKNFSDSDSGSSSTSTPTPRATYSTASQSSSLNRTNIYSTVNMQNDVKKIIDHWKITSGNIIENSASRVIFRFWLLMPAPKNEVGMSVYFTPVTKDTYNIVFWTDDIVKVTPRNQIAINELIRTTSSGPKRLEVDKDGDLRYKVGLPSVKAGESFKLFNDVVLEIMRDCNALYNNLSK